MTRRDSLMFGLVSFGVALGVVYAFVQAPTYTDAFYYINAANRLVSGQGLTDAALWMYIGMPETLPAPSHIYWMPMASWVAAFGMWLFDAPGSYPAAQVSLVVLLWCMGWSAFWLAHRAGLGRRAAWIAGLMVLFGGFFAPFWGVTETFTPFGAFGGGAVLALCLGLTAPRPVRWFTLAGVLAAAAHLTRADGVLLVVAGGAALLWPWDNPFSWRRRAMLAGVLVLAYLLTMSPWLLRNMATIGAPLPTGGAQGIWYTEYNDIFNFPPDASPARFFEMGGWGLFWSSRWLGVSNGLQTLLVVEGFVILGPFMLAALWQRWREPFWRPFWIYALGLHLAMTVVFPFPGYRGGLFHSAAALMPFWAVLALLGLRGAVGWAAKRRRWNRESAQVVFSGAALVLVVVLSVFLGLQPRTSTADLPLYEAVVAALPPGSRVMLNDPSAFYYHTGVGGVALPNEPAGAIPQIAERYAITHILFEDVTEAGLSGAATAPLRALPQAPPSFLQPVPLSEPTARLYRIELPQ